MYFPEGKHFFQKILFILSQANWQILIWHSCWTKESPKMSWRTRIERGEGEVKERKRKKFFLVSSSFDPAKEFSSIEFFKKIYPGYLFAKFHSTLFLWQISLVNLVIHTKSFATKNIQHCFYHDCNIVKNFQNRNKDTGTSIWNGEIWQTGPTISKFDMFQKSDSVSLLKKADFLEPRIAIKRMKTRLAENGAKWRGN